jgi:RNA-splicing ligase RtcB
MTEKPEQPPTEGSSGRPPMAEQIRAKMDEYDVERHLNDLASTLEQAVRTGVAKAGEFAHEHRGDIERLIDKAASAVDRRTEGRHADRIQQVRGSLERGVEKIADQRGDGTDETGTAGPDVPPSNG